MIIKPEIQEQLQQLSHSPLGHALSIYLKQAKEEINDVKTIESWEEALGRKFTLKVIDDLFFFMDDKKKEEIKNKNQYV